MRPAKSHDYAVIGSGIVGSLAARQLTERAPHACVVVIDRDVAGGGASRRSAGLHFPRGATEAVREMSAYSEEYYRGLSAALPGLPIHPVAMSVVVSPEGAGHLHPVHLPTADLRRTDRVHPMVRVPEGGSVWEVRNGHFADVEGVVGAVTGALCGHVSLREGIGVTAIDSRDTGVTLTLSDGDALTVGGAVLAPGPWLADPAWRDLLEPTGARVKQVVALIIDRAPAPGDGAVVFPEVDAFLLPRTDLRHWLFSFTRDRWDVDPRTMASELAPDDLAEGLAVLRACAPELASSVVGARVFCDAYSPDRTPIVRPVDDHGRVVFAGAANGSGYRLAPAIAARAATLIDNATSSRSTP